MSTIDFDRLFNVLPSPYMILDSQLRFLDMNARYLTVTERTRGELVGRYVFDAFPERGERLAKFKSAFEKAIAGEANSLVREPFSVERPECQGGGRREVYWTCHNLPVFTPTGQICGMLQKAEDVTAEVNAESMRDVIAREFDHRIRNILATVTSIARATALASPSPDGFLDAFDGRIEALARTHEMLSHGGALDADLGELVAAHIRPYRSRGSEPSVGGPAVRLSRRQTQGVGMALHELATNAAKYGALSRPEGRLSVLWTIDVEMGLCTLNWQEGGLRDLRPSTRTGFGTKILTRVLPMELGGKVDYRLRPTGLHFELSFPLR
jgi:PAS domain S-box-containing protein